MSRVAESSIEVCFFFENDGKGSELGAGETAKPDPAYMAAGLNRPASADPPLLIFESSDSPRLKIDTFIESSELDLFADELSS